LHAVDPLIAGACGGAAAPRTRVTVRPRPAPTCGVAPWDPPTRSARTTPDTRSPTHDLPAGRRLRTRVVGAPGRPLGAGLSRGRPGTAAAPARCDRRRRLGPALGTAGVGCPATGRSARVAPAGAAARDHPAAS